MSRLDPFAVGFVLAAFLGGCTGEAPQGAGRATAASTQPVRLIDLHEPSSVEGRTSARGAALPPVEWRFDGESSTLPAALGVTDLALSDGALRGTVGERVALLHLEHPAAGDDDYLHAVEIRARISGGSSLSVRFQYDLEGGLEAAAENPGAPAWGLATPLVAGELQTYLVTPSLSAPTRQTTRHVLIRPSDSLAARFEIESVRLVFRKEYLASLESGVGWHGLAEIYHEALLARSGETLRYTATLPARPRLDLELGSIENAAVTFRVELREGTDTPAILLERTVTTPERWEPVAIDLGAWAGRSVELALSVHSTEPGVIGLFGNPVLRSLAPPLAGRPRGVILILADTLRRDHLDAYGYHRPTAPGLARMAAEGARFAPVAQGSWTKVSVPSIVTSLYQRSHGVTGFSTRLPAAAVTLAEIFREAGYATIGFSSVPFTGKFNNMHQGYETLHEATSVKGRSRRPGEERNSKSAREFVDRFLPWLERHREVPFFVFLHLMDPHDPFEPRSPYATMWADPAKRAEHVRQHEEIRAYIEHPVRKDWGMPSVAELEEAGMDPVAYITYDLDWYDGSIRGMDAEITRVFERLRQLGLERDVVVAFTSDHGEEFHDHGEIIHGHSLYTELLDVPLILWGPGRIEPGVASEATVETIDLMPTLLELAGLESPAAVQGRSLVPLMRRDAPTGPDERVAFAELAPGPGGPLDAVTVLSRRWKLIHNLNQPTDRPEFQLFDRNADVREQRNIAGSHPDLVARLQAELVSWRERTDAVKLAQDAVDDDVSAAELERLRALGYVQ